MEMQLETPKEMSSAYSLDDLMAMQMVSLTDCCWVWQTEKGLEQLMAMLMAKRLA